MGIPRSGSTLTAALVDSLENSICFSEPDEYFIPPNAQDKQQYINAVLSSPRDYRKRLLSGEPIKDRRNPSGKAITNYIGRRWFRLGRKKDKRFGMVTPDMCDADTLIAVKHNIPFLSVLPELSRTSLKILGIVRHPLPTILSWVETKLPITEGHMPSAEAFWPALNQISVNEQSAPEAWALIYENLLRRMKECNVPIIKYEDMTKDISMLEDFSGRKLVKDVNISPKSLDQYMSVDRSESILKALRKHSPVTCEFYDDLG